MVETDLSLNHDPQLAGVLSVITSRTHGVHNSASTIATRRFPSIPDAERPDISGDDSVARQCAPVGDSLNNEQCGDHLSNPTSR